VSDWESCLTSFVVVVAVLAINLALLALAVWIVKAVWT
jgi:hypothetical protein